MSALTIIRIYLTAVLGWALIGAVSTYVLLLGVFSIVGHTEGLAFSWLPVPGFFAVCMGVGALIGGGSGVEDGQYRVDRKAMAYAYAARSAVTGEPCC